MKKIMFIGKTTCGKTTLAEKLLFGNTTSRKTQAIERLQNIVDTPGEYIENPRLYRGILITSYDMDSVAMVQDVTDENSLFPPEFATAFNREVVGIITKMDLKTMDRQEEIAEEILKKAGAKKIFKVSVYDDNSLSDIKKYIFENEENIN